MRDINRLDMFYNELMKIHKENFPDWRFGQLVINLEKWMRDNNTVVGMFYAEEDKMLKYIRDFVKDTKTCE